MNAKEVLTVYAAESGVKMEFDENGACTLPLDEERVLHLQFRDGTGELDLLALLGTVPEELRGYVFEKLLAANYYWKETLGATLSWHEELEQVVLTYPIKTETTDEATLRGILDRFADLQNEWAKRLAVEIAEAEVSADMDDADDELSDLMLDADEEPEPAAGAAEVRFDV